VYILSIYLLVIRTNKPIWGDLGIGGKDNYIKTKSIFTSDDDYLEPANTVGTLSAKCNLVKRKFSSTANGPSPSPHHGEC